MTQIRKTVRKITRTDPETEEVKDVQDVELAEATDALLDEIGCCLAEAAVEVEEDEKARVKARFDAAEKLKGVNQDKHDIEMQLLAEQYPQYVRFMCSCGGICNFDWIG